MFQQKPGIVPPEQRKILYFGTDIPSVAIDGGEIPKAESLIGNLERLKTLPINGLSVQVLDRRFPWPQMVVGHNLFSTTAYDFSMLAPAVAPMKRLKEARNLTDNFLLIACHFWFESGPKNVLDLFADARWDRIFANVGAYARLAREAGTIKGLILDIEPYSSPPPPSGGDPEWGFNSLSSDHYLRFINKMEWHPNPIAGLRGQANKRGKQFWEAIERAMPGAVLFLYFGNWYADRKEDKSHPDLFPPFLDGILQQMETMRSKGYIVDGYEPAYQFQAESEYRDARKKIRESLRGYSAVETLYDKYVRVGFGKWMDAGNRWDATDTAKNEFTPKKWEDSVRYALKHTDEYVWVWAGGQSRLFTMSGGRTRNVSTAYLNAFRRAKSALAPPVKPAAPPKKKETPKKPTKKTSKP